MAKIRVEDVYDEDDEFTTELSAKFRTHKHKNPMKDSDDIYAKSNAKYKTCKMKKNRRNKCDYDN